MVIVTMISFILAWVLRLILSEMLVPELCRCFVNILPSCYKQKPLLGNHVCSLHTHHDMIQKNVIMTTNLNCHYLIHRNLEYLQGLHCADMNKINCKLVYQTEIFRCCVTKLNDPGENFWHKKD